MKKALQQITASILALTLAAGCASAPFNRAKPVQSDVDFWQGPVHTQEGRIVDSGQMIREFRTDPTKAAELEGYEALTLSGILLGTGGAFAFGYGLGKALNDNPGESDGSGVLIGVGVAALVAGVVLRSSAQGKLRRAVHLHNSGLTGSGDELRGLPAPGPDAPSPKTAPPPKQKGGTWLFSPLGIAYRF